MKTSALILLGVVVILLVGGACAFTFKDKVADVADGGDYGTFHKIANKVDKVAPSDSSIGSTDSGDGSDDGILSEIVKFNGQNGEGSYREVTYKDGGFRQFDTETGDLIGSSYDEDQEQLGVVDGNLE